MGVPEVLAPDETFATDVDLGRIVIRLDASSDIASMGRASMPRSEE